MWGRLLALVHLLACSLAMQAQLGEIRGAVVDERGIPLPGATVGAVPEGALSTAVRSAETGQSGEFIIADLPWAEYKLFGGKESAGYPDSSFAFYTTHELVKASLSPSHPTARVLIRVGPKAGIIEAQVTDAQNNKQVEAILVFRWAKRPQNFFQTSVQRPYRILVPSGIAVTLQIESRGYETWKYPGTLLLKPSQKLTVDAKLTPEH